MKNILFYLFAFVICLTSCEDVVDIDTADAPQLIVVDAMIDNLAKDQTIKLSYTLPYFEAQEQPVIQGASVSITNGTDVYNFIDQGNGDYTWFSDGTSQIGNIDDVFQLNIETDGKTLTSTSILNAVPPIDSITQEFRDDQLFGDDGYYCEFFSRDLVGFGNTYWIKSFKNDTFLNRPVELNLAYDAAFDAGSEFDGFIFIPPIRELVNEVNEDGLPQPWELGDRIKVEIHSLNNEVFDFMFLAQQQILNSDNGIFATPVVNSDGNIINLTDDDEILGVFNIAAVSSLSRIIEE